MGIREQMKQLQWAAVAAVRSAVISGTYLEYDMLPCMFSTANY